MALEILSRDQKNKSLSQFILKQIIEFKGWEFIFRLLFGGFLVWAIFVLSIVYHYHTSPEYASAPKFSIYDFKLSFIFAFCFFLYKKICELIFFDLIKTSLDPEKFPTD